jgi:hypothetical protein
MLIIFIAGERKHQRKPQIEYYAKIFSFPPPKSLSANKQNGIKLIHFPRRRKNFAEKNYKGGPNGFPIITPIRIIAQEH